MKLVKIKMFQTGEYPVLNGYMKVFLDDMDITDSVQEIKIHAAVDTIATLELKMIAEVDVEIDKIEGINGNSI
jgi:hypothetical protein